MGQQVQVTEKRGRGLWVRRMEEKDLDAVLKIEERLAGRPWTRQSFLDSLAQPQAHLYTAVEPEGEDGSLPAHISDSAREEADRMKTGILGYVCCYTVLGETEIVNVAVEEKLRRQGIGRKMLEAVLQEESQGGTEQFVLEVRRSNIPAQQLYRSTGFEECGIRKGFYEMPAEDALIMVRKSTLQ